VSKIQLKFLSALHTNLQSWLIASATIAESNLRGDYYPGTLKKDQISLGDYLGRVQGSQVRKCCVTLWQWAGQLVVGEETLKLLVKHG
jgi:hypothetical protein